MKLKFLVRDMILALGVCFCLLTPSVLAAGWESWMEREDSIGSDFKGGAMPEEFLSPPDEELLYEGDHSEPAFVEVALKPSGSARRSSHSSSPIIPLAADKKIQDETATTGENAKKKLPSSASENETQTAMGFQYIPNFFLLTYGE